MDWSIGRTAEWTNWFACGTVSQATVLNTWTWLLITRKGNRRLLEGTLDIVDQLVNQRTGDMSDQLKGDIQIEQLLLEVAR